MNFFKDKNGRVVIAQMPNLPLIGWFVFMLLDMLWKSHYSTDHSIFGTLSFGFIFTWAWLEISSGVNYFRRTLGLLVLSIVVLIH